MAVASLFHRISRTQNYNFLCKIIASLTSISAPIQRKPLEAPLQVRSVVTTADAVAVTGFDEIVSGTQWKYYMLGGKRGVGKTSCAASLAVKFINHGHPTIVVSTDPAHSLSDSFDKDLMGGTRVPVEGVDSPLYALEINTEKARNGSSGTKDFMDGMGLGMLADQLGELKLGELLDAPPPGLDEAIAISKCLAGYGIYNKITRIIFDTAPMGHTLHLLSLPDFMDASIGKMMQDKLGQLRERMGKMQDFFVTQIPLSLL